MKNMMTISSSHLDDTTPNISLELLKLENYRQSLDISFLRGELSREKELSSFYKNLWIQSTGIEV